MNKILALAAATLIASGLSAGLTGAAHAGPNCNPGAASSYAPKASAAKQAKAPVKANVQRVAQAPVTAQGGGDGDANAPVLPKKAAQAATKIEKPAVVAAPQGVAAPSPASTDAGGEYTSVSGIAARLAALAAQQKTNEAAAQ